MNQADLGSRDGKRQGMGIGTAMPCCAAFTSSTRITSLGSRVFDVPVCVNHLVGMLKIRLICWAT